MSEEIFEHDIVVVFDLEWTSWEGSVEHGWSRPGEHREIVQIGAVKVDMRAGIEEIGTFQTLIKPTINPILSDHCMNQIGITQSEVDTHGIPLGEAVAQFAEFIGDDTQALACNGNDDLYLVNDCRLKRVEPPLGDLPVINLRPLLYEKLDVDPDEPLYSSDLPELLGLPTGVAHHGLSDARALASTLRYIREKERTRGAE